MTRSSLSLLSKVACAMLTAVVLVSTAGTASGRSPPTICESEHNACFKDCAKTRGNCLSSCGQVSPTDPTKAQERCTGSCQTNFAMCEKRCIAKKKECDRH